MSRGRGETIGDRIRRLRGERRLSQRDLAGPGVTGPYISRIEHGDRVPSHKALRVIARNLGVSVEYLETGRELGDAEDRELRLGEAELQLRLGTDPGEAEATLRSVLKDALAAGDGDAEIRARIGVGLAASYRGDHGEAIRRLGSLAQRDRISPVDHPDAFAVLGRAYVEQGRGDEGVDLFRRCLEQIEQEQPENLALYVRFAGYLAYALVDTGGAPEAEGVMAAALERARELADPYTRIRIHWAQAKIADARGRGQDALRNMRHAIALLSSTEDTLQLGRAQMVYGELLLSDGRLDEAGDYLDLASEILEPIAEVQDRALLRSERAKLEARRGNTAAAIDLADQALELVGDQDDHERARALWARAEALAGQGHFDQAIAAFAEAYDLVRADRGVHQHEIPILRAWASTLRAAARQDEAIEILDRVAALSDHRQAKRVR